MRKQQYRNIFESSPLQVIVEFLSLNEKEAGSLKKEISESGGKIRIFIHPMFKAYARYARGVDKSMAEKMEEAFQRLLRAADSRKPPLLIFVGGKDRSDFERQASAIRQKVPFDQKIYFIQTLYASPTPLDPCEQSKYKWPASAITQHHKDDIMWEVMIEKLKNFGVTTILLGGTELIESASRDRNHDLLSQYSGCVGTALKKLQSEFQIEYSKITWPAKFKKEN